MPGREEGQKKMRAWEVRALKSGRVYCWPGSSGHCSAILKELIPVLYTDGLYKDINIHFYFQKDDITNCFMLYAILRCLELSLLKSLFICLFTFGAYWNLTKKAG